MEKKHILIAVDKFKGSLTSLEAAQAIEKGFEEAFPGQGSFRAIEIADGGDGSLEVLKKRLESAGVKSIEVHDPVGKVVRAQILLYEMPALQESNPVKCAFIEMARISGLEMLAKEERNPLVTSSYGMGEAILAAIECGACSITLSIGGSATNDGGAGMLQALGYRFYDVNNREIAAPVCGGDLQMIASIVAPQDKLSGIRFRVICDVVNPLLGENGATAVYGPQKGADGKALALLESGMTNYASVAQKCLYGKRCLNACCTEEVVEDYKSFPGSGAAGGVGFAGLAFLGAELIPGWQFFADITSLEESIRWADVVVTGEGCLDSQSMSGKVVNGVVNIAKKYNKKVLAFCGISKLESDALDGVEYYSIASLGYPIEVCMSNAAVLLQQLVRESLLER
ncbi:MAG: glycerate kinase [Bacteroidales bacterium]|nr:glycerate kinase [Bacteroidales bacterium]